MNRQDRISKESTSTNETEDPDFEIENMAFISPTSIHESIKKSSLYNVFFIFILVQLFTTLQKNSCT